MNGGSAKRGENSVRRRRKREETRSEDMEEIQEWRGEEKKDTVNKRREGGSSMLLHLRALPRFPPRLLGKRSGLFPREARDGSSSLCRRLGEREGVVVGLGVETREGVVDESEGKNGRIDGFELGGKEEEIETQCSPMSSLVSPNSSDGIQKGSIRSESPVRDGDL